MTGPGTAKLARVICLGRTGGDRAGTGLLESFADEVIHVRDGDSALRLIDSDRPDLVVVDEAVPAGEALGFLGQTHLRAADVPVVVVTRTPTVGLGVGFVKAGAYDYIAAPLDRDRLGRLISGMQVEMDRRRPGRNRFFCSECPPGVEIVGTSPAVVKTLEMIRLVAQSRCNPVLILGETGTGKELAARAVHAWRCGSPEKFVAVNCAALTAGLLESELFGHVKGAFTGADSNKTGLFEAAGGGTIFLDEISEMDHQLQAKLLRVLQERTFRKVGSTHDIPCKATIIASSNRNLLAAIEKREFRRDLYYRLAVFPITLAPLRDIDRRSDVVLLAEHFAEQLNATAGGAFGLSPAVRRRLESHEWPGNVRELRNVIERAAILARNQPIAPQHILIDSDSRPSQWSSPAITTDSSDSSDMVDFSLAAAEREFIRRALRETGWQRTRAAALLGITRATLHAKLKKYNITPPDGYNSAKTASAPADLQGSPA